jgi:spore coat protein CotH
MKVIFTPREIGVHTFHIFDEVDGRVSSIPFSVISNTHATELQKKKVLEEEERRRQYRELLEKQRNLEKQRKKEQMEKFEGGVKRVGDMPSFIKGKENLVELMKKVFSPFVGLFF